MANSLQTLQSELQERFSDIPFKADIACKELTIEVPAAQIVNVCQALRNRFDFSQSACPYWA